jgi:chromosome segregation ATPase
LLQTPQYLQQEVESLRGQLQDSIRQCSSLEAEVRLLKQQAAEAKADARQDKQHLEQKLHEQQVEAARQQTLAEQANLRQQRALEEVAVAQQDLSAAKQQLQKSDLEREAAQHQLQGLHAELRKLRATHTEADRELRQLQLQVQQQQQQERRLQEQLTAERQQRQEEATATRASIEQHRIELRRCAAVL